MARAYGANASLLAAFESTYGSTPVDGYWQLPFVSTSLGSEQGLIANDLIGLGRDPSAPIRDVGQHHLQRLGDAIGLLVAAQGGVELLLRRRTAQVAQPDRAALGLSLRRALCPCAGSLSPGCAAAGRYRRRSRRSLSPGKRPRGGCRARGA